jgi:hypothetical protein
VLRQAIAEDEQMRTLLRKRGARFTVDTVTDRETAQAILDGTLPACSLRTASNGRRCCWMQVRH